MQGLKKRWFPILMAALSCYAAYLYINQQAELDAIKAEREAARQHLNQLQQTNAALKEERKALHDNKYIEKLAREELGLVRNGEIPYIMSERK